MARQVSDLSIHPIAQRGQRVLDALRASFAHHFAFLTYVLLYILLASLTLNAHGIDVVLFDPGYFGALLLLPLAICGFWVFGHVLHHVIHVRPFSWRGVLDDIQSNKIVTLERLCFIVLPILAMAGFSSVFSGFKSAISAMHPFEYDVLFMDIDRWLHFGYHPWELLQPVLGSALATSIMSFFYNLWFFVMYGVLIWQIFSLQDKALRMQYLLTFVIIWSVLGSFLALLMSAAGPVYYEHFIMGYNPYTDLMTFLKQSSEVYPVWSLMAQDYLWNHYDAGTHGTGAGIAAMPSLHVGVVTLQALLGWRVSKWLGVLLTAYGVIIMLGSVHLAWHYAIDGYLSFVITLGVWYGVGWGLRRGFISGAAQSP